MVELIIILFLVGAFVHYCQLRDEKAKLQKRVNRRDRTWEDDDEPTNEFNDWQVTNQDQRGERVKFKTKNFSFTYRSYD